MALMVVAMCRNEADIAPTFIRHLLAEGVDHFIILDNGSTDGTVEHLEDFIANGVSMTLIHDPELGYWQAKRMTAMTHQAGTMGAQWVIPADFDELWMSPHGRLRDVLSLSVEPVQWVEGFYHVPHEDDDASEPDPVRRMQHRRVGRDCPQSKVCFRYTRTAQLHMGNHNVDGVPGPRGLGLVAFREFQYRSYEHFVAKVRHGKKAYDATNLPDDCGIHWRRLGAMTDDELAQEWAAYLATPTEYDPAPVRTTELEGAFL